MVDFNTDLNSLIGTESYNVVMASFPQPSVANPTTHLFRWLHSIGYQAFYNVNNIEWKNVYSLERCEDNSLGFVTDKIFELTRLSKLYNGDLLNFGDVSKLISTTTAPSNTFYEDINSKIFGFLDTNAITIDDISYESSIQRDWIRFAIYPYLNDTFNILLMLELLENLLNSIYALVPIKVLVTEHINYDTTNMLKVSLSVNIVKSDGSLLPYTLSPFLQYQINQLFFIQNSFFSIQII